MLLPLLVIPKRSARNLLLAFVFACHPERSRGTCFALTPATDSSHQHNTFESVILSEATRSLIASGAVEGSQYFADAHHVKHFTISRTSV
jgi:hypothetical protein